MTLHKLATPAMFVLGFAIVYTALVTFVVGH